jgi:hypothetical protein
MAEPGAAKREASDALLEHSPIALTACAALHHPSLVMMMWC